MITLCLYAWQSENFLDFLQNPFYLIDHLKVFFLHLELSSDQENKKGFPDERLWFLGHRVELMPFQHLEKVCE